MCVKWGGVLNKNTRKVGEFIGNQATHNLYLIMRHWTLCRRQIIHISLQIRIQ